VDDGISAGTEGLVLAGFYVEMMMMMRMIVADVSVVLLVLTAGFETGTFVPIYHLLL
jgi:hypothetical protein